MDIKQLQYFVVSVDMGSFHAAAETLITTQPNVSKVIKALEAELDMTLLERNRSGVSITKDGEKIYEYAIDMLKNMKLIQSYKKEKYIDKLSICSVPSNKLSTFLVEFYNYDIDNEIEIDLYECGVEEIMKKVHRRDVELGFVHISNRNMSAFYNNIKSKGLEYKELMKVSLCLFVGKNNNKIIKERINEKTIRNTKLIQHYEDKYSLFDHLGHLKEDAFYIGENTSISYTNSDSFLIQLLKSTDFCSIGSSLIKDKYERYGIQAIPISQCSNNISFGYLKRSRDELSDIGGQLVTYLEKNISNKSDLSESSTLLL